MPQQICAFCRHEQREEIEQEIVGGMSQREAARRYNLHKTQIARHLASHYSMAFCPQLPKYRRAADETLSDKIEAVSREIDIVYQKHSTALEKTRELHVRVNRVMEYAERLGHSGEILKAASELRRIVELEAKLTGEADQGKADMVIKLRRFDRPEDDPEAYDEIRYKTAPRSEAALPAGDEVIDADYRRADEVVQ